MSRPERTCAMCGDPIPTGRPRVELRIQAVEPQCDETVGNWTHETRHGLAAAQLCEECGADVTDRAVSILNGSAGGGFDATRYRKTVRLLEEAIATMAAWGAIDHE